MQPDFWHQKWQKNEIGFHLSAANPWLVQYLASLQLAPSARILLPLCGKTLDIAWLLSQGFRVVGVELSAVAIDALFEQLAITPSVRQLDTFTHYSAPNIDLFVGDLFQLTPTLLGKVDAVHDRAALVALPEAMRKQYTAHLRALTHNAPQLLIGIEYDQTLHAGPPFSITAEELHQHYQTSHTLTLLASKSMADGLKGQYPATEHVWQLAPR